ncbi:MAG: NUDIX hydrolase [bacterium]|nr:NUDIX hydrolase [bacterium]
MAVWHQDKLLIIKNSYKKRFTIPCGRIKRGEDIAEAAVRELREEVGIILGKSQIKFVGEYSAKHDYATDIGSFLLNNFSRNKTGISDIFKKLIYFYSPTSLCFQSIGQCFTDLPGCHQGISPTINDCQHIIG